MARDEAEKKPGELELGKPGLTITSKPGRGGSTDTTIFGRIPDGITLEVAMPDGTNRTFERSTVHLVRTSYTKPGRQPHFVGVIGTLNVDRLSFGQEDLVALGQTIFAALEPHAREVTTPATTRKPAARRARPA